MITYASDKKFIVRNDYICEISSAVTFTLKNKDLASSRIFEYFIL